jgi:hypothetical protein
MRVFTSSYAKSSNQPTLAINVWQFSRPQKYRLSAGLVGEAAESGRTQHTQFLLVEESIQSQMKTWTAGR